MGHVTPRQTSEREFGAPPRAAAANYARSDAHATPTFSLAVFYVSLADIFFSPPFFFIIAKGRSSFTSAIMRVYVFRDIVCNKIKSNIILYISFFFNIVESYLLAVFICNTSSVRFTIIKRCI